jgi:hypothetical protein
MTVTWKNIKAGVGRIDYTYSFNGTVSGGGSDNFGATKTGSHTVDVSVPSGANLSFTAKVYTDFTGTNLLTTLDSGNSSACNA